MGSEMCIRARVRACQRVDRMAGPRPVVGQFEKVANARHGKPQVARAANEIQSPGVLGTVVAIVGLCAGRGRENALAFIVTDGFRLYARRAGEFTDAHTYLPPIA